MRPSALPFVAAALAALGCAPGAAPDEAVKSPIVYGADDRVELFEIAEPLRATVAAATVALLPRSAIGRDAAGRVTISAPTLQEAQNLCAGERFADQPAAAFCSGVLVDDDLVLTAGHCTRVLALNDLVAVLGYGFTSPAQLEAAPDDVIDVREIVAERLDPSGAEPRLDFAWLRLARRAPARRRPAALRLARTALAAEAPLVVAGAVNGAPLKVDAGGRVADPRATALDYFVSDTDTSHGASGAPAFDADGAVAGILARGDDDLEASAAGCRTTVHQPESNANEQYTYVWRAVDALCSADPTASSVCRADCGSPCQALAADVEVDVGCAIGGDAGKRGPLSLAVAAALMLLCARRRARREVPGLAQPRRSNLGGVNRPISRSNDKAMRERTIAIAAVLVAGALYGCGGAVKMHPATAQRIGAPAADKVEVVFMRTSLIAGAISADLFEVVDGKLRLIGVIVPGKKVVYVTTPGRKVFMAYGSAADFMLGDLAGGRTYYSIVRPNWGSGGMIPTPIRTDGTTDFNTTIPDFKKWVSETTLVEPDAKELEAWNSTEQDSHQKIYDEYWARFETKTPEQKAERTLRPEDGLTSR